MRHSRDASSLAGSPSGSVGNSRPLHRSRDAPVAASPQTVGSQPAAGTARLAFGDVVYEGSESAQHVNIPTDALQKFLHMAPGEERAEQAKAQKRAAASSSAAGVSCGVIHPLNNGYRAWWMLTVVAACLTGWLVPFRLAYLSIGYRDINGQAYIIVEAVLLAIFATDMFVSLAVGHYNQAGLLVLRQPQVALHYLKHRFVLDFVTTVPFDVIALAIMRRPGYLTTVGREVSLLALLKLGRMYRVVILYNTLSYNLNYSLLALSLIRNFTFCAYLLHWAACAFWWIARFNGFIESTWVAAKISLIGEDPTHQVGPAVLRHYLYSLYWSTVTFATLGYGDVTPYGWQEVLFTIVYILINLVVYAYILGTITLLVTKQDGEIGQYRDRMAALNTYTAANNIPSDLKTTMAGLLRLHMSLSNTSLSDEQVLAVYPAAIRRKILRQLYAEPLRSCYLLHKCSPQFLDALLMGARVELFLPRVEIVSALDHINELNFIVAGHVEVFNASGGSSAAARGGSSSLPHPLQMTPQPTKRRLVGARLGRMLQGMLGDIGSYMNPTKGGWLRAKHKASRTFGESAAGLAAGYDGTAAAAAQMPVSAMRRLNTRSTRHLDDAEQLLFSADARAAALGAATLARKSTIVRSAQEEEAEQAAAVESAEEGGSLFLAPGDSFAEVAYFTEVPRTEVVRSLTVCRVLVVPRSLFNSVARDFPISARQVLANLKTRVEQIVASFLPDELADQILKDADVAALHSFPGPVSAAAAADEGPKAGSGLQHAADPDPWRDAAAAAGGGGADAAAGPPGASAAESAGGAPAAAAPRPLARFVSFAAQQSSRLDVSSPFAVSQPTSTAQLGKSLRAASEGSRLMTASRSREMAAVAAAAAAASGAGSNPIGSSQPYAGPMSLSGLRQITRSSSGRRGVQPSSPVAAGAGADGSAAGGVGGLRRYASEQLSGETALPAGPMGTITEGGSYHAASAAADGESRAGSAAAPAEAETPAAAGEAGHQQQQQEKEEDRPAGQVAALNLPKLALRYAGQCSADDALLSAAAECGQLTLHQQQQLADLLRLRQLVNKAAAKMDQARLSAFLDAAAKNEVEVLQDMLEAGVQVDSPDYDGRTGLMVAAQRGNKDAVLALLFAGANPALLDARGRDALIDAAQGCHSDVLQVLRLVGATTQATSATQAFLLCKAAFEGRLDRLANLLQAGCAVNAQNYDRQSALHVAAAEGNLPAAKLLIAKGADMTLRDRWGLSPLDFAHRAGDGPLLRLLLDHADPEVAAAAAARAARRLGKGPASGRRQGVLRVSSSRRSRHVDSE